MHIMPFFDDRTSTMTYVVSDPKSGDAVVVDPVLDYDVVGSKLWTEGVNRVLDYIESRSLKVRYILETHAHADHLSGAQEVKARHPAALLAVGARITEVQEVFKQKFDLPADFPTDGQQFDRLLNDGEIFAAGTLEIETIFTPGHTPACVTFRIEDAIFTGDAMFMPDSGTGRCDFPLGSAGDLFDSITQKLYALPDDTRVFVGHDYQPDGRALAYETTIAAQKAGNIQLPGGRTKEDFVAFRSKRDAGLSAPKLLFHSIQVNIDAGQLPHVGSNEMRYLKIPLNVFRPQGEGALELHPVSD